jgi:hypothetical protein
MQGTFLQYDGNPTVPGGERLLVREHPGNIFKEPSFSMMESPQFLEMSGGVQ